jgi:hypothetical protein
MCLSCYVVVFVLSTFHDTVGHILVHKFLYVSDSNLSLETQIHVFLKFYELR